MADLADLSAAEQAQLVRDRKVSPVELTEASLARIAARNPSLNAVNLRMDDIALAQARTAEAEQMRGEFRGALHGVPYLIKDNEDFIGLPTTVGTSVYGLAPATQNSPIVERMQKAGAIPVGKTTMPELGWKGLTDSPRFGVTRNPWDLSRNAGGSSGGSAAGVAVGMAPLGTGSDGAGSIRIPASFCGIYGLKPSHGRVPLFLPNVNQHTHDGPLARTVTDAAIMMDATAGPDDRDLYSLEGPSPGYRKNLGALKRDVRVAYSPDLGFARRIDPEVAAICQNAALRLTDMGWTVDECALDLGGVMEIARISWQSVMSAQIHHKFAGRDAEFEPALIACANGARDHAAGAFLHDKIRAFPIYQRLVGFFDRYDFLITPTVSVLPVENDRLVPADYPPTTWDWMEWAPFSSPFNLFHNPAASVPAGHSSGGLPVGLQIVGRRHADLAVLQASFAYEEAFPWRQWQPS
ncbi:MAG: hypothetical protein KDE03_02960 [Rhodobacteraceae bacterium]|nr:hypothetical protein [Paracoccaceae bacterium]